MSCKKYSFFCSFPQLFSQTSPTFNHTQSCGQILAASPGRLASSPDGRAALKMSNRHPLPVSIPREMIAEACELAKGEYAIMAQVVRRTLQKEIDWIHKVYIRRGLTHSE
jgi:hypothetical protein